MSSQSVPIHRTNATSSKKDDTWFNPFDFSAGQDANIRWLSRPSQQSTQGKYSKDTEKFRITFDAENFKPEQIKLYIQNRRLTISGVYEERHEGSFTQKQFERTFDIPPNADVNVMAAFITANHMLVVEIPLGATPAQVDHLNVDAPASNQRRLSFSLDKFNSANNTNALSTTSNDLTAPPNQSVRRTSITKTTTTTTTTGSSGLSPEIAELLKNADNKTTSTTINQPQSSSTTINKQTLLTSPDLANLPIDIPPELLASGGTITIQKRRVSVSKTGEAPSDHNTSTTTTTTNTSNQSGSVPINRGSNTNESTTSTTTTTTNNQSGSVPINRGSNTNESTKSTTTNQSGSVPINRGSNTNETTTSTSQTGSVPINRGNTNTQSSSSNTSSSTTTSQETPSKMYTLEEFLQNKTWNPSLSDGANGKKILHMRLQMKSGVTADQVKISLNGFDLRVEVDSKTANQDGRQMSEHSYRQVTLFPTCEVEQLKTELKSDGYLHIQVPMTL